MQTMLRHQGFFGKINGGYPAIFIIKGFQHYGHLFATIVPTHRALTPVPVSHQADIPDHVSTFVLFAFCFSVFNLYLSQHIFIVTWQAGIA